MNIMEKIIDREVRNNEIRRTKECRKQLDEILQNVKQLFKNRETSIVITKVQEAIMWLGMNLKALDNPNPYPDSYNPDNTKVAPTSDGLKL